MKNALLAASLLAACGLAFAKLPALDEAAQAKAAETKAKADWQAKVDAFQLCKAQDRIAARYAKTTAKLAPSAQAAASATPASTGQTAPAGTPVASAPPPPCTEPGPFAYTPPAQKPLESSGAHSPAPTAASPPSGREPSAEIAPAKK